MKHIPSLLLTAALIASIGLSAAATTIPAGITNAIGDSSRPEGDKAQDPGRKPGEVLAFTDIKPGDKVVDFMPGGGYFTRIFSKVVGSNGIVYALQPTELDKVAPKIQQGLNSLAANPAYGNVKVLVEPVTAVAVPEKVDMVWTSQNYHDLHDPFMGSPDIAKFNKAVYAMLKPGGTFLVLDHVAAAGSGLTNTDDLHRIDPATVKAEVTAAGFEFVGESDVLRNPEDDHTIAVFKDAIKGKSDKFIYKFRKPAQ